MKRERVRQQKKSSKRALQRSLILLFTILVIAMAVIAVVSAQLSGVWRSPWTETQYLQTVPAIVDVRADVKNNNNNNNNNMAYFSTIPRRIWTYWEPPLPREPHAAAHDAIVRACIGTWRESCPGYDITVLTLASSAKYLPPLLQRPFLDSTQRYTDFLRLFILAEHGGIWLDASIFMTRRLDDWLRGVQLDSRHPVGHESHETTAPRRPAEVVAYYMEGFTTRPQWPMVESWFIAAVPRSLLVQHWRNAFCRTMMHPTERAYLTHVVQVQGVDLQNLIMREYLTVYVAFQVALQTSPPDLKLEQRVATLNSNEGPFRLQISKNWNSREVANMLCSIDALNDWLQMNNTNLEALKIVKLRSSERHAIAHRGCVAGFQRCLDAVSALSKKS